MKNEIFVSVWDGLEVEPQIAANLKARSELLMQVQELIKVRAWSQTQIAELSGITQPRVNDLLEGRINNFSLDTLVKIAASLGQR